MCLPLISGLKNDERDTRQTREHGGMEKSNSELRYSVGAEAHILH
jgi:hypothetical protein